MARYHAEGDLEELQRLLTEFFADVERRGESVAEAGPQAASRGPTALRNPSGLLATSSRLSSASSFLTMKDDNGRTLLHVAAANGHLAVVRELLKRGVQPAHNVHRPANSQEPGGGASSSASSRSPPSEAAAVAVHLPRVDEPNSQGNTALHFAAIGNHIDVATTLLAHGWSTSVKNLVGATSLREVQGREGFDAMEVLLLKHDTALDTYQPPPEATCAAVDGVSLASLRSGQEAAADDEDGLDNDGTETLAVPAASQLGATRTAPTAATAVQATAADKQHVDPMDVE